MAAPKPALAVAAVAALRAGGLATRALPALISRSLGPAARPPYRVSPGARALHERLRIADLHADSLLPGRDLALRSRSGSIDVPRLLDGNVAVQVLSAATAFPIPPRMEGNDGRRDAITALAVLGRWPRRTWRSRFARALLVAERARRLEAATDRRFVVVRSAGDLAAHLARREADGRIAAGVLSIEGAHALDGDLANLRLLVEAGYRILGLTHLGDNEFAGSAHGLARHGLTPLGRDLVARLEASSILVDVAHASVRTIDDVLTVASRPVIASHTGVTATCPSPRNLSDAQLRGIAATGGVVGIGFWPTATCGHDAAAIARSIVHAISIVGPDHVALGSDFDGAPGIPFDASGLALLTEALLADGLDEAAIRRVMGENVLTLLARTLPS
ncbi:MAG TPA: membrane dipeptidase [Candidatus Limnocylindrales bacterium]|nr:membrane dipeptidase [Candidatus Limnocylindrales bacterium]